MGKNEVTEKGVVCSVLDVCFSFDVGCSMFDVHLSKQPCTSWRVFFILWIRKGVDPLLFFGGCTAQDYNPGMGTGEQDVPLT